MPIERSKESLYRPTRVDKVIQFLGDDLGLGGPMTVGILFAVRVACPVAMALDKLMFSQEESIEDLVPQDKKLDSIDPKVSFKLIHT